MTTQFKVTIKRKDAVFTLPNETTWNLLLSILNEHFPKSTPNLLYYSNPEGLLVSLFDDEGLRYLLNSDCKEVHIWSDPTAALNATRSLSETFESVNIDNGEPITDISSSIAFEKLGVMIDSYQPTLQNSSTVSYAIGNLVTVLLKHPNSVDLSSFERWLALMSTEYQSTSSESESESETSSSESDCVNDSLPQNDNTVPLDTNERTLNPTSSEPPIQSACNFCTGWHHKRRHHGFHHLGWTFAHNPRYNLKHEFPSKDTENTPCSYSAAFSHGCIIHGHHGHGRKGQHKQHGRHNKGGPRFDPSNVSHDSPEHPDAFRHNHRHRGHRGSRPRQPEDRPDVAKDDPCAENLPDSAEKAEPPTTRPESDKKGKHHHHDFHHKRHYKKPGSSNSKGHNFDTKTQPCLSTDCMLCQKAALHCGKHNIDCQDSFKKCPIPSLNSDTKHTDNDSCDSVTLTDNCCHYNHHSPCAKDGVSEAFGEGFAHTRHCEYGKHGKFGGHGMHGASGFGGRGGHGMHGGFGFGGRGRGGRGGHGRHGRHGGHGIHGIHGGPEGFEGRQSFPSSFDFYPPPF
ncbi:hypothetical protein F4703DRAFT_1869151 [Phycomyces blakesleeanus]